MMPSQWDVCQLWIKLVNLLQTSGGAKSRSDSGWRTRSRDRKSGSSGISSSCSSWKCFTTRIPAALKNGSMAPQQVQSPQHGSTARVHSQNSREEDPLLLTGLALESLQGPGSERENQSSFLSTEPKHR